MMILRDIKSKMILTMLLIVLSAQGVWAEKVTPTMEISPLDASGYLNNSYKNVYPKWGSFDEPTISLYTGPSDNRTSVLPKYQITYYIDGQENKATFSSDEKGRQITTDDKTGTTITRFYGDVQVGANAGTVTIRVVAKVKEAYANDYAETVSATYKFNINKVTPSAYSVSPDNLTVGVWHTENQITETGAHNYGKWFFTNTSAMIPVPNTAISITHNEYTQDLSKVYDVSFAPKAGSEGLLEVKTDGASQYIVAKLTEEQKHQTDANGDAVVQDPYKTKKSATLVATFTPKEAYKNSYTKVTSEIPVTIQDFDKTSKMTVSLTLDGVTATENKADKQSETNTLNWSRWNDRTSVNEGTASHHLPKPIVVGSNGAILSKNNQLSVCYFAVEDNTVLDDCQKTDLNPGGDVWNAGESTSGNLSRTKNIEYRLNGAETLYTAYKPGLIKVGAFVYLHDDGGAPAATNEGALDNWYQYWDEQTVLVNASATGNTSDTKTYRRVTPVKYFYIKVLKRVPELVFNPDPTDVHYSTADQINMNNRFELTGKIGDENDGTAGTLTYDVKSETNPDTFWYTFEFPTNSGIVVNNWPHNDRMKALTADGKIIPPIEYDWDNYGAPVYTKYKTVIEKYYPAGKDVNPWWYEERKVKTNEIETFSADEATAYNAKLTEAGITGVTVSAGQDKNIMTLFPNSIYRYWSVKGFGTDDLWSIQFTTPSTPDEKKEITYTIHPFNHARWDKGITKVQTYIVDAAKQTTLHIDPKELVASISQVGFVEPEVWVTDAFGEEVSDDYSFQFEILSDESNTGTTVTDDGGDVTGPKHEVTIGNKVGDVVVKVTASTTNAKYPLGNDGRHTLTGTYTIHILNTNEDTDPLYEIISSMDGGAVRNKNNTGTTDEDYAKDKVMGKMHFIKTGKFYSGYTISGVPGIDIRFGVFDGSTWNVKEDTSGDVGSHDNNNDVVSGYTPGQRNKFIGDDTPVVLNKDGIATGGHFYEFYAHTNGFLTVDARWEANHTYVLIDYDHPEMKYVYTPTSETKGDYTFPMAMLEDHSYHLYCTTGGQINMHGLSFEPAFINNSSDTAPVTSGTAFLNGFPAVPVLAEASMPIVTYSSANEAKATVVSTTGAVTPKALTFADDPNYVRISGKVVSQVSTLAGKVFKMPYYNLVIADIPTYRLGDDLDPDHKDGYNGDDKTASHMPAAGEQVTTYNMATPIIMTYGGWSNTYKQITPTETKENVSDGFKTKGNAEIAGYTSTDTQFNKYIDGFSWSNVATQNPSDERGFTDYKNYITDIDQMTSVKDAPKDRSWYMNTFTLPAHGAYWRFEPQTSGYLFVYLVQNGICSYTGDPHSLKNTDKRYYGLDWKPLYIVDETGSPVSTASDLSGMNTNVKNFLGNNGSFTRGLIRCDKNDSNVKAAAEAASGETMTNDFSFLWDFKKDNVDAGFDIDYKGSKENLKTLHSNILKDWKGKGDTQKIFQDPESKGYSMISKAYVRYAIRVRAGKSYWVFQNASKPNLCGFGFVPDGFPKTLTGQTPQIVKINDNTPYETSISGVDMSKDCNVTYEGRTWKNRQWTSLCLPFAVSEHNFHEVFGENAKIVTFDNLNDAKTNIHFVQHNYRMLEAGRPYFVYPDWGNEVTTKESLTFYGVTLEGKAPANNYDDKEKKVRIIEDNGLQFVGTYDGETMPMYSYFVSAADGKLKRVGADRPEGMACKRYRAYLKNPGSNSSLAKIGSTLYEEPFEDVPAEEQGQTTRIVGVSDGNVYDAVDHSALKNGIYTLNGQMISTDGKNVDNLPAGIYIIKGKKKIVK